jgi:hypothetical protein
VWYYFCMSNPATPAQAATPGQEEQGSNPPVVTPAAPASPAPGNNNAGVVTIPVEEYARLNRDAARTRSFDKRVYQKPTSQKVNADPNDPSATAIAEANAARDAAEKRAMQAEVRGKVRDLLADDRFKELPKTTKDLILQSPHMLTQAETLDEAMYDIEEKLMEMAGTSNNQPGQTQYPQQQSQPGRSETPPVITPGAPAPVDAAVLEDTTNLRGANRSTAVLRNAFKKQKSGAK